MTVLVIGIGNLDRGDDAAGIHVVRRLRGHRTKELADCSGLLDVWAGEDRVIVVDAMQSGRSPGTVHRLDPVDRKLPVKVFPSTHAFGLAEAVELGRALSRLPGELHVYGIEAAGFESGADLSTAVARAVELVAAEIEARG